MACPDLEATSWAVHRKRRVDDLTPEAETDLLQKRLFIGINLEGVLAPRVQTNLLHTLILARNEGHVVRIMYGDMGLVLLPIPLNTPL
jgi:hypothetical protein